MKFQRFLLYVTAAMAFVLLGVAIYVFVVVAGNLPSFEQLENPKQDFATKVLSADGEVLDHFFVKRRTYTPFDSIPRSFIDALIATEDREFREHWGIHSMRIIKAMVKNMLALRTREGASTITQQLARNLFLTPEQSLRRKILEAFTAIKLEQTYTKNEILELYTNTVYFGRGAYGLQVAAQVYFNKSATELTTAECAYLVAVLKGPELYNAKVNYERAIQRRNLVLRLMLDNDAIQYGRFSSAIDEPITLSKSKLTNTVVGIAPHFVEMVRQALEKDDTYGIRKYDLYRDGLVIYTSLNAQVQRHANAAVVEHLRGFQAEFLKSWSWSGRSGLLSELVKKAIRERPEYIAAETSDQKDEIASKLRSRQSFVDSVKQRATLIQTALVILDPFTGNILGMVGGAPESLKGLSDRYSLNHATQIRRQPGSAFKPFVYASALENGYSSESMIESGPFSMVTASGSVWSPGGYREEGGAISLRQALQFSINSVAARLIDGPTTPSQVVGLARRMGITTPLSNYPSIALGSEEVIPLELTSAYGVFLNHGIYVAPTFISRIEDMQGNVLFEQRRAKKIEDVLSPSVAKNMVSLMQGVVNGGTASSIRRWYSFDAAGKTGTTNDFADAWFVGITPQLAAGVWIGFDDQRVKFTGWYGQGGKAAAPVWGRAMGRIYGDKALGYTLRRFNVSDTNSLDSTVYNRAINPPVEGQIPSVDSTATEEDDGIPLNP